MALGLDYDLWAKYNFWSRAPGAGSATFSEADINAVLHSAQLDARARGTIASSKEDVPNKLLDFSANAVYVLDAPWAYVRLGGMLTYETDQSFDNKQFMYGVTGSASKVRILVPGDAGTLMLGYGTVDPSTDTARKRALAGADLSTYQRWNAEVSYSFPINKSKVRSLDFDYRHYQETSPPTAVEAAKLDRHHLGLVRVNLEGDFFLQYSHGSLPFDQQSERAVKIGWSLKFE